MSFTHAIRISFIQLGRAMLDASPGKIVGRPAYTRPSVPPETGEGDRRWPNANDVRFPA
jgi:hypothetical protein